MRDTHTHKGHCQVCGRVQAVSTNDNLIAKHGYDVQFGFFNGTCKGSDIEQLEVSKLVAEATISNIQYQIKVKREELKSLGGVDDDTARELEFSISSAENYIKYLAEKIETVNGNPLMNVADGKELLVNMETEVAEGFNDYEVVENQYGKRRNYLAGYQKSITKSVSIGDITLTITRQKSIYTRRSTSYRCAFSLNGKKIAKNKLLETMGVA